MEKKVQKIHPAESSRKVHPGTSNRTKFSDEQVSELVKKFHANEYPSGKDICELVDRTKLREVQVRTWFQNRRTRARKRKISNNRWTGKRESKTSQLYMKNYFPPVSNHDISPNIDLSSYSCSPSSPTTSPLQLGLSSPITYSPTNLYDEFLLSSSGHPTAQSETDECAYYINGTDYYDLSGDHLTDSVSDAYYSNGTYSNGTDYFKL